MIDVTVRPAQALTMGRGPARGSLVTTHRHIPGTVLRGALADTFLVEHGRPEAGTALRREFVELFERGVRFGPLLAPGSIVVPLSVRRCKYRARPECLATWHDEAEQAPPQTCGSCSGPLEPGRGEVEFFAGKAPVTRRTRVALGEDETARDGMLYDRDEITPGPGELVFTGRILGGGDWLRQPHELLLGGRRSTSGAADYLPQAGNPEPLPAVGRELLLRLVAPAILVDDSGRPTLRPDVRWLADMLGCPVRIERSWIRRERLGGWHAAANLPKPEEHAIAAGSSFLLELGDTPDPERVRGLVTHGIGLRRAEGFGWIELGPATPPASGAEPEPAEAETVEPETVEAESAETATPESVAIVGELSADMQKWLHGRLKDYLAHLAGGGTPNARPLAVGKGDQLGKTVRVLLVDAMKRAVTTEINQIVHALELGFRTER